ncbi:MAG: helix-turn-helix domain-containing protein [Actinomycetota bacterium]
MSVCFGPEWTERPRGCIIEAMDRDAMFRPSQAAERLQISRRTLNLWAARGELPYMETPGGHRRYPRDHIESLRARLMRGLTSHQA